MDKKKKKRNGEIDFLKFVFALIIVIYHFGNVMHTDHRIFSKGYIGVEFFFIVSGYLMAASMEKVKDHKINRKELAIEWKGFIKKKYLSLWPVHLFAYIVTFFTFAHYMGWTAGSSFHKMLSTVPEIFLVQMAGFQKNPIVGQAWYLSAMILVMFVIYPLLRRHYEWFSKIAAPVTAVVLVIYLQVHYTNLDIIVERTGLLYAGVLRGCAEILLGIFMERIGRRLMTSNYTSTSMARGALTVLELLCYGAFIGYAYNGSNTRWEFPLIFVIALGIAISFSGRSYLSVLFQHEIFTYLGKISFPIYLNQIWVRMVMVEQDFTMGWTSQMLATVLVTILVSIICLYMVEWIKGAAAARYRFG